MKDLLKKLKLNESNVSMLLGIVVVLIVGSLLVNYFRSVNDGGDTSSTDTTITDSQDTTELPQIENLPADYTVQASDSLWKISESVYGTGYNWSDIYNENREVLGDNPNTLLEGTTLTIPDVSPKIAQAPATGNAPVVTEHTVVAGDNLWRIAVSTCNDGYSWPLIAQENDLSNPNVIEIGQVLKIACR